MITVDFGDTYIIHVPQSFLTLVQGTLYELDTNALRLALKDIEDSEEAMPFPKMTIHNTEFEVAGVTYARSILIVPPYSLEFEDGPYSVRLSGSNNNFFDIENGVLVQNQVQVIGNNSAGLTAPGFTEIQKAQILEQILELWRVRGLDPSNPVEIRDDRITTTGIQVDINQPDSNTTELARVP